MTLILAIEDEPQILANVQQILELADFDVICANNGESGLELAQKHLPDLIVCDIMVPKIDGYQVLHYLRSASSTSTIPLIFLTAKVDRQDFRKGMLLGADDYLTKPFTPIELIDAVNACLQKRALIVQQYQNQLQEAITTVNYLISHDTWTGLPNQLLLKDSFEQAKEQAQAENLFLPLMIVAIDQFNRINSSLGHVSGNLLLESVAQRLKTYQNNITGLNLAKIIHLGGTRFVLLLKPSSEERVATTLARDLLDLFRPSFVLNNHEVFLTASIGIAYYPNHGEDLNALLACAEGAMLQVQEQGGNHYRFYTPALEISSPKKLLLEADLHYALEREELQVYYQPLFDIQTETIVGAEALMRWHHPEYGKIPPTDFIPLAEETGLIVGFGQWILQQACLQAKIWQDRNLGKFKISVNVSARQFYDPNFLDKIRQVLRYTAINPASLTLELTENIVMQNSPTLQQTLKDIKALGVRLGIDDFGTGYSSLNYLKQFPFDSLKIDQCFVRDILKHPANMPIITSIIQISQSLNLELVAEGVETTAEFDFLRQNNCLIGQGYYFSEPLSPSDFEKRYLSPHE